ncbi:hypothetical protein DFP72DRAFT_863717 [Ephemerocybe angulata]|uniref:Uncharacterized protein n=1 Tax=Ephemerocybe angulata TaxID=980116 RepID=A0A8H6H7L7_9AGAR|nr:hypothetical protein DFP72DRAFT_863717 [Tulosesus angulatus]
MRRVLPRTYRSGGWAVAVKKSGLAKSVLDWSDRRVLAIWQTPFAQKLLRLHRVDLTYSQVLVRWTPASVVLDELDLDLTPFLATSPVLSPEKTLQDAKDLIKFLEDHPDAVPLDSSPTTAFFLCSQGNFHEAWTEWLFFAIQERGYNVQSRTGKAHYFLFSRTAPGNP